MKKVKRFIAKINLKSALSSRQIPAVDPLGNEIPMWKREMLAKKAAEKAKQEALDARARLEEERRNASIPAWKRQLIEKKDGENAKR